MAFKVLFGQLLLLLICNKTNSAAVICYFAGWTITQGLGPELFDANLCTHVNYAFIGMWEDGNLRVLDDDREVKPVYLVTATHLTPCLGIPAIVSGAFGQYGRVAAMKRRNPNLKVLLSVGGATAGSAQLFSSIAADPNKRGAFIGSATYFLQTYNFDGLDIDWEIPQVADKQNYITLLRETKAAFQSRGWLVTAAVAAIPGDGYDIAGMNQYLDIINLMTYDFYGPWSQYTGQNSPLFSAGVESDWEKANMNLAASANHWVNLGAQRQKLAIGTAFYGRSFTLADPGRHGLHAPITGPGVDDGAPTYLQTCTSYAGWTRVWDDQQKNPYKYAGNQWIGYDDKDSIWTKGDWIKKQGFFGAMVWTINFDDVKGQCGENQLLLKQLNRSVR